MPKKILLADDSITIQKVVELTFSDGDYEVIATNNGNKAIQKLAEVRPDIILSDIIMPEKNGYELCEYVKSHPDFRHIPVILLTGTFEPFDPDRAEKAGCDAVITKPFESQSLIHKVEELTQQASAAAPSASRAAEPRAPQPAAFTSPIESEPEAGPPPKLDIGWTAASSSAPAETSFSSAPEQPFTPPSTSPFQEAGFEEQREDVFSQAPPSKLEQADFTAETSQPQEPEVDYDAATKAFPKVSFEDFQRVSTPAESAPEPEIPPLEPSWTPPAEAAPASEWAAPELEPSAFTPPPSAESPFGESQPAIGGSESVFESAAPEPKPAWRASPPLSPPGTEARAAETPAGAVYQPSGELSDEQIDRIARRVVELMSDQVVRNIAWEVIPDLAEMVVRERIRQLENES